jgi:MoaA/NifB/PqqE/SkfB family radical SAM enzyme
MQDVRTWTRLGRALLAPASPAYVIAFVTGRCAMLCPLCCPASTSSRKTPEMTPEQWGRAFRGLSSLVHLTITGGEPFVRRDLVDVILAMARASATPRISINTAGSRTEDVLATVAKLLELLPGTRLCLSISLDGPAAVHDRLRGLAGGFAAARETIAGAAHLRSQHGRLDLRVSSLLQKENRDALPAFLEETQAWPIDYHEVIMVRDVEPGVQRDLETAYADLTATQLRRASAGYARSVDFRIARELRRRVLGEVSGERPTTGCMAGGRMVEVFPDGLVRGCEMKKMWGKSTLGSVAGGIPLTEVVAGPAAARFRAEAASCRCSFECAIGCDIAFRPSRWWHLL